MARALVGWNEKREVWVIRWRDPDGSQRTHHRERKKDADALAADVDDALALKRCWSPRRPHVEVDLEAGVSAYVIDIARTHQPSTVQKLGRNLALFLRFLEETERGFAWSVLSRQTLADYHMWLSSSTTGLWGNARAPVTVKRLVEVVQTAWKWWANHDDFLALSGPARTLPMARPTQARTVAPTLLEASAAIAASGGWYKQLATLLYGTGLRIEQAMRLRFDDLDFTRGALTIRSELGKTASERTGRVIPLAPWLLAEVAGWGVRDGWLIKGSETTRIPRRSVMLRAWRNAGVREAVWQQRPFHAFRKGFVSGLKALGADNDAVEFLVGHSLGLRGVYTDPDVLELRAAVALLPAPSVSNVVAMARGVL